MQKISFYFDPLCPWCWMTANWLKGVREHRELSIEWKPISLAIKNGDMPEPYGRMANQTLAMLRVVEHMHASGSQDAVEGFYWAVGESIHKAKALEQENSDETEIIKAALAQVGLPEYFAAEAHNEDLTKAVEDSTKEAIALCGEDVGTPIIAMKNIDGQEVALFGPVISELPKSQEESLKLWDAYVVFAQTPYFWELKRTRNVPPQVETTF